jgi:zinc transport system permease protein
MGVILVAAMLVVPVAGATQVSRSFSESLLVSIVLAELAVLLGIGISYYAGATAGGVIVLVAVGIYVLSVFAGKVRQTGAPDETRELDTISQD